MKTTTTNLFNTYADFGKGPLKAHEIQIRTLFDILFADELLIPGNSLLCNPATNAFIMNNPDLLEGFLKSGKIRPIVTDKNETFSELTGFLKSRNSVSLNVQDIKITEKNAEFMDSCLDQKNLVIISQKELDDKKTEISKEILNRLPVAVPALNPFIGSIIYDFNKEHDKNGIIRGSWWNNLAKKTKIEGLSVFDDYLSEIGTIVFDLAYQTTPVAFISCPR